MKRKFTIQLTKGKVFQMGPERIIIKRLINQGFLNIKEGYSGNYDCNDGIVHIIIDDTKLLPGKTFNQLRTESRSYSRDESRFKD